MRAGRLAATTKDQREKRKEKKNQGPVRSIVLLDIPSVRPPTDIRMAAARTYAAPRLPSKRNVASRKPMGARFVHQIRIFGGGESNHDRHGVSTVGVRYHVEARASPAVSSDVLLSHKAPSC